jgi:hypothetical protein
MVASQQHMHHQQMAQHTRPDDEHTLRKQYKQQVKTALENLWRMGLRRRTMTANMSPGSFTPGYFTPSNYTTASTPSNYTSASTPSMPTHSPYVLPSP